MLFNFTMLLLVVPMGCYASSRRRRRGNRPVDRAGARLQLDVTAQPALRAKSGNYEYLWRADVRPDPRAARNECALRMSVGRTQSVLLGTHDCRVCN